MVTTFNKEWPKVHQIKIHLACAECGKHGVWVPKDAFEMRRGTIPGGWIDWNGYVYCPTHAKGRPIPSMQ